MERRWRGGVAAGLMALAVLAAAGLVAAQENTFKIGFVDIQKVLNESAKGKEAKAKLEKERDTKQQDIRAREEEVKKLEADLQKRETELLNEVLREIRRVVVAYGKEQQYTLILEAQSGIIYASQGADLTDEILATFNQQK